MKIDNKKNAAAAVAVNSTTQLADNNNSSAEDEDSDSFSDDSSSDSKVTQKQKRKIPQFSVSQSDTVGLRMKISAIHRTTNDDNNDSKNNKKKLTSNNNNVCNNNNSSRKEKMRSYQNCNDNVGKQQQHRNNKRKISNALVASSSSCCSVCSRSESECSTTEILNKNEKPKKLRIKRKRINSEIIHEVKCNSASTDSDFDTKKIVATTKQTNNKVKNFNSMKTTVPQQQQQGNLNTTETSSATAAVASTIATGVSVTTTASATTTTIQSEVTEVLPGGGSCLSSSDTELPALVNAAIKCVESCSDSENPSSAEPKQYTSSLLLDFMVKTTQMLGNSTEIDEKQQQQQQQQLQQQQQQHNKKINSSSNNTDITNVAHSENSKCLTRKRRGRPKKNSLIENVVNESADSGITSITQSLSPSPKNHQHHHHHYHHHSNNTGTINTNKSNVIGNRSQTMTIMTTATTVTKSVPSTITVKQQQHKLSIENLDKRMYAATERVLYPQRGERKKTPLKQSTKNQKINKEVEIATDDNRTTITNSIDPLWKKIDVNMKFRRPSLTGYKSDGGGGGGGGGASSGGGNSTTTVCSKILAARSGYVSDYGSVGTRNYSGYKSDVSGKSRSSMRSCISRAKSCDYSRSSRIKRLSRRRRSSVSSSHHVALKSGNVNEQDILQLAGLSLGQSSEESSRESICKTSLSKEQSKLYGEINRFVTTGEYFGRSSSNRLLITNFADLPLLRRQQNIAGLDGNEFLGGEIFGGGGESMSSSTRVPFTKEFEKFSKRIRSRRSSAVSRCSSFSAGSRHDSKRRRRKRMRYRLQSRNGFIVDSKLNTEIDILINSFPILCKITSDKNSGSGKDGREKSEKEKTSGSKSQNKRSQKKKKQNDTVEHHHHHQHHTSTTTLKRRHKKAAHASPDDHKLPLKKRHYLLTPGEKSSEGKNSSTSDTKNKEKDSSGGTGDGGNGGGGKSSVRNSSSGSGSGKSSGGSKTATVVTPKKRHLLETTNSSNEDNSTGSKSSQSATTISLNDAKAHAAVAKTNEISDVAIQSQKSQNHHHVKGDTLTKKKNRLEGLLSKIQSVNNANQTVANSKDTTTATTTTGGSTSKSASADLSLTTTSQTSAKTTTTTGHPPPGVFEPTVELEIQIPLVKLATDGIITTKSEVESPKVSDLIDSDTVLPASSGKSEATKPEYASGKGVLETLLNKTAAANVLLKRKRKKPINRTGFPSLKRKKRKIAPPPPPLPTNPVDPIEVSKDQQQTTLMTPVNSENLTKMSESEQDKLCDRVPHDGEASDTFLKRNSKQPRLSVVSLDRLQDPLKKRDTVVITPTSTRMKATEQNSTKSIDKLLKNSQRGSPNHRVVNNVIAVVDPKKSNESKTETEMGKPQKRRRATSKDKRTNLRVGAKTTKTPNAKNKEAGVIVSKTTTNNKQTAKVAAPTANATKANSKMNNAGTKATQATSLAAMENNKSKTRLTTVNNAESKKTNNATNKIKATVRNKNLKTTKTLEMITSEKEASEKVKNKKFKKENQRSLTATNSNSNSANVSSKVTGAVAGGENKQNQNYTNKKSTTITAAATVNNSKDELNESQKITASLIDSAISHLSEELEQEPLPPLEVNDLITDSADETVVDESDSTVKTTKKITKWKKAYLTAGLFSDTYKSIRTKKNLGNVANKAAMAIEKENTTAESDDNGNSSVAQPSLLPPPPYCEKFFRRTIQDFLLPYDIWWAYKNSKLPTKVMVPSWNYKKIRTNVYNDVRPNLVFDRQQCICKPESGCGDDCLNRMVYAECSPANCPCGDKCTNQKIQKHEVAPGIERFMTQNKGWGVKTTLPVKKGTYILEYVGEVVTEKEFKERMATLYANDTHHYCLHLDGGLVIDGHRMGSDGRFVNHSCSPNCEMQKWSVNGLSRMALFALRDIEPDEELTYDYNFSLFNPSEGQLCRCETPQCRGVIGGKSQRVKPFEQRITENIPSSNAHSRSRKRQARKNSGRIQSKDFVTTNLQQPSDREKKIIKSKNCFLMRNLEKVRRLKMKSLVKSSTTNSGNGAGNGTSSSSSRPSTPSSLAAQISALLRVPRNTMQTRVLTQAVTDPEVEKMAKLAAIFREICLALEAVKDDEEKPLIAKLTAASKRKQSASPQDHHRNFTKSIDFSTVQGNVEKGHYKTPEAFDEDVNSVFANAINYFEPGAEETLIVKRLSKEYTEKKKELYGKLVELIGEKSSKSFRITAGGGTGVYNTHEDVIRCICGLFKDEGLMIQCSKCLVWQHTECTKANVNDDNDYLCERCEPRKVDLEIPLDEYTEENYRYYLSLLRGDLQVRQGDTVYVLRDIPIKDDEGNVLETKKHTYETIGKIDYSECDIFRVERLWKDNDGKRFIFGHHYLRPHETFHEPSRKFYENEVVRVPLYEVIPIELVIARCWVLDRKIFCLGRPIDCTSEDHVYICELRVNKTARLFAKNKQSYPICVKNYAFRRFKDKLNITRTYAPHDVDPALLKMKKRKTNETTVALTSQQHLQQQQQHQQQQQYQKEKKTTAGPVIQLMPPPPKTINEKRSRLENILKNLRLKQIDSMQVLSPSSSSLPLSPPLDLSYLLTGRGARQRRANATIVPL